MFIKSEERSEFVEKVVGEWIRSNVDCDRLENKLCVKVRTCSGRFPCSFRAL